MCSLLATGPSEGTFGQDEKNSTTPFYANVEMDDGSVPMTTNPSYGQIELSGIHNKPIYGNLQFTFGDVCLCVQIMYIVVINL